MKKITLLIISIILSLAGQAQDYKIDFTASGITNTLDSVHVINLKQQTELTLNGTDTLHLYNNTGISEEYKEKNKISFYPNPLRNGEGKLRFYQKKSGDTKVEVYDIEGKLLLSKQGNLQRGHNEFMFTGMPTGFFMVHVKSTSFSRSLKIISIDGKQGIPEIEFVQNVQKISTQAAASSIKLVKSIIGMQYNAGDRLKLMGYANNDTCIYFYIPDKSQMIDFVFGSYYPSGTVHCGVDGPTAVVDVTNPITVETWMDRNLGASQQATSSTDSQAYGDLYQWGRFSDGHQCRNSGTTNTQSSSDTPGHSDFIKGSSDWRSPQNNNLWQGVNGINNPCPSGYRLPTINELNSERQSWSSDNAAGAYGSPLKWPAAGYRFSNGSLGIVGYSGYYWSFTVDGSEAYHMYFRGGNASMSLNVRADGYSVRCLKDASTQPPSIYTHPSDQTTNDGGNASFGVIATGGSLTYQWQESTDGGTTWNNLSNGGVYSNVTTNTMNITSATLSMDSTQYRCVLSASGLPVDTSNAATLTVIYISTGSYPPGTVHCISGGAAVVDVTNSATGEIWMDRNLGAFQQATSSTDSLAYGDLYQWGRFSDGHQCRSSNTANIKATTAMPNNGNPWDGKFITAKSSYDWLSSQNNNLWQGVNGTNNPCPNGYRLPTKNELNSERQSWSSNNAAGAYGSPLKLPVAGGRYYKNGSLLDVGSDGLYESSTVSGPGSDTYNLYFSSSDAGMDKGIRAGGASIRCLKDGSVQPPSIKTHPSGQTINDGGNASFSVSATGSSLSYQWQESTDGGTTWNPLSNGAVYSNVTTDTMNITSAPLSMDSNQYRCILIASGLPVDTSNAATLTVITTSSSYPSGTVHCISGGAAVVDVTNLTTGEIWMDRNLGASRQATSSNDSQAYGDLYQWGRFSDGHQCRNSGETTTQSSSDTPGHGDFIKGSYDWRSPQNNNLWQGVIGTNNPCPSGYRLPTENELNNERQSWSSNDAAGAYGSPLKLPVAGYRFYSCGLIYDVGSGGLYGSSTVDVSYVYYLSLYSSSAGTGSSYRAYGYSVRCLKDVSVQPPSIITYPSDQTINDGGNASFKVSAIGSSLSYQWQESTDGGTTWNGLSNGAVYSNVTTDTMNITSATLSMDSNQYRCMLIASGLPVDTSNSATLTVITTSSFYPSGTIHCISGGAAIVDVTNPTTGETWMDRNFAASQQATSSTDSQAYGDLYQWGRFSDGHQCRSSDTTNTNASTATPNNGNSWDGKFITHVSSPYDWLSSQNNNLWQGINGTNNPCPSGYRLPTENELNSERQSWSSNNPAGAYSSPLKLPIAGGRSGNSGSLSFLGGYYWSSTVDGSDAYFLIFNSGIASISSYYRAFGGSVRCLKD